MGDIHVCVSQTAVCHIRCLRDVREPVFLSNAVGEPSANTLHLSATPRAALATLKP